VNAWLVFIYELLVFFLWKKISMTYWWIVLPANAITQWILLLLWTQHPRNIGAVDNALMYGWKSKINYYMKVWYILESLLVSEDFFIVFFQFLYKRIICIFWSGGEKWCWLPQCWISLTQYVYSTRVRHYDKPIINEIKKYFRLNIPYFLLLILRTDLVKLQNFWFEVLNQNSSIQIQLPLWASYT